MKEDRQRSRIFVFWTWRREGKQGFRHSRTLKLNEMTVSAVRLQYVCKNGMPRGQADLHLGPHPKSHQHSRRDRVRRQPQTPCPPVKTTFRTHWLPCEDLQVSTVVRIDLHSFPRHVAQSRQRPLLRMIRRSTRLTAVYPSCGSRRPIQ
jgi:hypothetical protein